MVKIIKNHQIVIVAITLLIMPASWAQRPSFAGSRPINGLNQKDKYHSTTPVNADIENRFGSPDVPTIASPIPFGQTQKPPVGYPVVTPESQYSALPPLGSNVVFEDRFGDGDTNTITSSSSSSPSSSSSASSSSSSSSSVSTTTQSSRVPLDAHGDQLLIDQLNRIPIDKRPFWFLNFQAIEAQRNGTRNSFAGAQGARGHFFG